MYRFTNNLPKRVCRNCGKTFDEKWSDGGVGAVCIDCFSVVEKMDLVAMGIVRNIKHVANPFNKKGSYTFESNIDGVWYKCHGPCGNWAYVDGWQTHGIFAVPVGWWALSEWYTKHQAPQVQISKRCHKCNHELLVTTPATKIQVVCPVCSNNNTYYLNEEVC